MTATLLRLIERIRVRMGAAAADTARDAMRSWMADPGNAATRAHLAGVVRDLGRRADAATGRLAVAAAAGLERYRRGVGAWERELMAARDAIPGLPSGPARANALDAYITLTHAAPHVVREATNPARALRQVHLALENEARMVRTDALGPRERAIALEANRAARAACAAPASPGQERAGTP
jgi:hypothetical protein